MAVSLKKPAKVDLSKPELPPKVREYTPVHLLDEDETIKKVVHSEAPAVSEDELIVVPVCVNTFPRFLKAAANIFA